MVDLKRLLPTSLVLGLLGLAAPTAAQPETILTRCGN
jgi:hypothetical protein